MTMKKLMMAVCFALLAGGTMYAQENKNLPQRKADPEKVAQRMASRLMLDDEAAAKFIPLYQAYMEELRACRPEPNKAARGNDATDEEIDKMMLSRFEAQEKRLDVQKKYYGKFKEVLTVKQAKELFDRPGYDRKFRPQGQRKPSPRR